MRSTWWLVVLLAGVVVLAGVSGSSGAKKKPAKSPAPAAAEKEKEQKDLTADGYGDNEKAARANALRAAVEVVEAQLREKISSKNRPFPARLLAPSYLEQKGVIAPDGDPAPDPAADGAIRARYKITVTDEYVTAVAKESRNEWIAQEKEERQERVVDRHLMLIRMLGGVLAVLLVVAGYLRLEEATRGYYTKLLRLGAFVLLVLAAVGLWMTI